ncbi:MAG: hypothetical protein M1832_003907 [Thelocarpon impressellum]|nr:MAG: hypothetical protein M1832_003907 [Thelocarpon impressellum]
MLGKTMSPLALGVVASLAGPASAFWKVPCAAPIVVERADPIVNPGAVAGHVHTIMGGNGFGFNMDFAQARASTCSSCKANGDMSNYWAPSLYYQAENGSFISVEQSGGMLVYYQQRMDPGKDESSLKAFPAGFRMLAGDPKLRHDSGTVASKAVSFACLDYNGPATKETNSLPNRNCPSGLRVQIFFPSCWNGKDLDSPDHRSHMAYPSTYDSGECPPGFGTRTVSLFYEIIWSTDKFKDMWYGDKQPFVLANGDPTGYGYHGDFVNGWDVDILQEAISTCKDGNTNQGGSGDITKCAPLMPLIDDASAQGCKIPPSVDEQVHGVLPALPGCNPVQAGPADATPQSGCGAPTTIGQPQSFFTDLTVSKKWAYLGCGKDVAFKARTLSGDNEAKDDMTVEKCVDFCSGKGFSYAGLEFARECFCGNDLPADRAPTPGIMGNCMSKCAGDATEYCGGYGVISLYKKCDGTCQNAQTGVVGNYTAPASGPGGYGQSGYSPSGSGQAPKVSSASGPAASESAAPNDYGAQSPASPASSALDVSGAPVNNAVATQGHSYPTSTTPAEPSASSAVPVGASAIPEGDSPGSTTPPGGKTASTNFTAPTNGSSSVRLPQGWRDVGCHVDPVNPRALQFWGWWGEPMTSSGCAKHCDEKGYKFAGTENAGQCFCANTLDGGEPAPAADCGMKCNGSDDETCGGSARLNLFTKLDGSTRKRWHRRHGSVHKLSF